MEGFGNAKTVKLSSKTGVWESLGGFGRIWNCQKCAIVTKSTAKGQPRRPKGQPKGANGCPKMTTWTAKWRRRPSCYNRLFPRNLQKNVKRRIPCSTRQKRETVIENETSPFEATAKKRQSVRPRTLQKVAKVYYCMRNQLVHLLLRMQIACKTNWPRRPKV